MVAVESLIPLQAAGNRFVVLDAISGETPGEDVGLLAQSACSEHGSPLDGLLILARPNNPYAAVRMIVYNRDGGRAESCGNGLRCVAKLARERGHVNGDAFVVETDSGPRRVIVERQQGRVIYGKATLGVPQVHALREPLDVEGQVLEVCLVDMGNPHCVVFVDDVDVTPVSELGPRIEEHARFPQGTNVEFVSSIPGGVAMRVWERGVGETASCGTGAAAVAVAALSTGRAEAPLAVHTRGGILQVAWEAPGEEVVVGGPVSELT